MIVEHSPGETSPVLLDWTDALDGSIISTAAWSVPAPLTKAGESHTAYTTSVAINGGVLTDEAYLMKCTVVTTSGASKEWTVCVRMKNK